MTFLRHRNHQTLQDHDALAILDPSSLVASEEGVGASEGSRRHSQDSPPQTLAGRLLRAARRLAPTGALAGMLQRFRRYTITVNMADGLLRVVVLRGRTVIAWGTSAATEDMSRNGDAPPQEEGPVAQLRALLKEMPVRRGRLVTCLPLYTPLTRRLRLPRIDRRYLKQVVLSELMETIPFTQEEVDVTWRHQRTGAGGDVVIVAVSREAMDQHVLPFKEARLRPAAVYSRAASLAMAAGVSNAIIVELGQTMVAMVLVRKGAPLAVHQVELGERDASPEERAESVARAVEQVVSYAETEADSPEEVRLPAVLTGQLAAQAPLVEALKTILEQRVLPFTPPLIYPDHFPAHEYAANLGMALLDRAGGRLFRRQSTPNSLLPERHLARGLPVLPFGVFVALLAFLYLAFMANAEVHDIASLQAALTSRAAVLERQGRSLSISIARGDAISKRTKAASQQASEMESAIHGLDLEMQALLAQMEVTTEEALPPQVHISTLLLQKGGFILGGTGPSYEEVIRYSESLQASGAFADVQVVRIEMLGTSGAPDGGQVQDTGAVSFQVKLTTALAPDTGLSPDPHLPDPVSAYP
ncbi:MAG: hypothetical protein HW388_1543 [Dehalococcoidia bacterium]|nr:hypothetical protein [Dehalococcoidia bacterium]